MWAETCPIELCMQRAYEPMPSRSHRPGPTPLPKSFIALAARRVRAESAAAADCRFLGSLLASFVVSPRSSTRPAKHLESVAFPADSSLRSRASTRELIEWWRSGDADALERLATDQRAILLARARVHPLRRLLLNGHDPADLVHDALARALASGLLDRFEDRGPGSLRNVLFRVLDRTILDALRAERADKRSANVALHGCDDVDAGAGSVLLTSVDHREPSPTSEARAREWIELCRGLLAEREWAVWSGVEIDGRSPAEVARALGLGESAARGLLFRARARILRELLAREG